MRKLVLSFLSGVAILFFVCTPALAQTTGTIRGQINSRGRVRQTAGLFRFTQIFDLFLGCAVVPANKTQRPDNTCDSKDPVQ